MYLYKNFPYLYKNVMMNLLYFNSCSKKKRITFNIFHQNQVFLAFLRILSFPIHTGFQIQPGMDAAAENHELQLL